MTIMEVISFAGDSLNSFCFFWLSLVFSGSIIASLIGFVIYQLYFHPLAKYPGPLLGRITQWYDVYHAYIGDKHILLYQLHQKYGTFVRFTPNTLSVNHPAALKAIYAHGANVRKSEFYKCFRSAPGAISTLLATEKTQHARKRRVMSQAFSDGALKGLEHYVQMHVQDLIDRIRVIVESPNGDKQRWSGPLDMQSWCNWLVFDIMGDLVFGKSFGTLGDKPDNRDAIWLLGRAARRNYTVAAMPALIHTGIERCLPVLRNLFLDRERYFAFAKRQVSERMKNKNYLSEHSSRKDIFSFLLHAKDPETGKGFSLDELWMEGNTLIVAGSDTSSTTLAAVLHYLLRNPSALTRLAAEVRAAFASAEEIRIGPQLHSCQWLRACIDETMRLTPAVAGLLPREVLPGGLYLPGPIDAHLPAGVIVGVPTYAIQHHPDFVRAPFAFDPSRWLQTHEEDERTNLLAVFAPFSRGPRACLGRPLVYMELGIALARLIWEYDMRPTAECAATSWEKSQLKGEQNRGCQTETPPPCHPDPDEYQIQDWFLSNNHGPFGEFKVRSFEGSAQS